MGEGIIKSLRPLSPTGIRDGWAYNLILNYYRSNVMEYLIQSCDNNHKNAKQPYEDMTNNKSFSRYGSKVEVVHEIETKRVLSVLYYKNIPTNNTIIGIMVCQVCVWYFCVIDIIDPDDCIVDNHGYTYFPVQLTNKEYIILDRENKLPLVNEIILWKTGIMLLNYWHHTGYCYYAFITDDGHSLNNSLNWTIIT